MGMITKYSKWLYDYAEYFDAIDCDCGDEDCTDCQMGDALLGQGHEVSEFEAAFDSLRKKQAEKDAEIERLNNNNEAYVEFCNSLFFDIPHGDPRLIKLKEKLTEAKP